MTDPQYVTSLADIYTKMYNHPGNEKPLSVQEESVDVEETPKWKRILRDELKKENRKRPPHAPHHEPREDASEEEENSKSLTLNEEEINVVQEALLRLEPESFWREGGPKDEFYSEEEVNRMLYIAQDILKRSGVE